MPGSIPLNPVRLTLAWLLLALTSTGWAADWVEGKHYFVIEPRQMTTAQPGRIEVTEAFSYGCPACNQFAPIADQIKASLPPNAQMVYLPASFNPSEDWPMFQRAFYAAQALGIVDRTHNAMFDAIWKSGELSILDESKQRLKRPLPSIEDAAKFYARVGKVKPEEFLAAAKSFGVESSMRRADVLMKVYKVPSTPTMVINGRYRTDASAAGGNARLIELVQFLVAKESTTGQ